MGLEPVESSLAVGRTARYYTIGPADEAAIREVWFVLHGHGQLAKKFVTYFADLADGSRLIVAPEALNRYYLVPADSAPAAERPVGATWMTREDRDHEIADYVGYLDALHAEIATRVPEPVRIVVVGFSQGAATAARWAARGTARLDHLVLWGGALPPEIDLALGSAALRRVPLTLVVGTRDQYITAEVLAREKERLDLAGFPYQMVRFDGGHAVSRAALARLLDVL